MEWSGARLAGKTIADAVSQYGAATKSKLTNIAISGQPEDQLRGPLETLIHDLAEIGGLNASSVALVGETALSDIKTRPDYAVTVSKALVGFIEVKAPGKGADGMVPETEIVGAIGFGKRGACFGRLDDGSEKRSP